MEAQTEKIQERYENILRILLRYEEKIELNNITTKMKNTLEGVSNRITEAEEQISELEDRMVEITAVEQSKERRLKRNEDSLRDYWDNIK